MQSSETRQQNYSRWWQTLVAGGLVVAWGFLVLTPYLSWARVPSLFDDDFTRVGAFRRFTLANSLLRPFNEHLAPLFEVVGWLAWWGAGQHVETVACGLLVASYVAWGATVLALGAVVRLELRSNLAALVAVNAFCLSPIAAETVFWYSASSFQWAAAASLAAWYATVRALRSSSSARRWWWLGGAVGFAAASPMFSAIGVLAGPLASLRGWADRPDSADPPGRWHSRIGVAVVPLLGTGTFAGLLALRPAHGMAVSASVRQSLDLSAAVGAMLRAPGAVLLPSILGVATLPVWLPDPMAVGFTLLIVLGVLIWARRSADRGLLVVGLGWVVGGYLLAYGARAVAGDRFLLEVGRYHLFPEVGVVCWLAAALRPVLNPLGAKHPLAGLGGVVALAAVGFGLQADRIDEVARRSFRFPDQGRALAAALRLEAVCQEEQVPLAQAIRLIDPTEPRWFPRPLPFNPLLYLFDGGPTTPRHDDPEARSIVLQRLSVADRATIFGGLDASRYRALARDLPLGTDQVRLVPTERGEVTKVGVGKLCYEEFLVPGQVAEVVALDLTGVAEGTRVEIWWTDQSGVWSADRSIRWSASPDGRDLVLARLPHWQPDFARRFRVIRRGRPLPPTDHPGLWIRGRGR